MLGVILALVAGFRPIGLDPDSLGYANWIINEKYVNGTEITFFIIVEFFKLLSSSNDVVIRATLVTYSVLNVYILCVAFSKLSSPICALVVYSFVFFPILNMTQIRFSLGLSFFLIGLFSLRDGQSKKYVFWVLMSALFHYSFIACFCFYFLVENRKYSLFYCAFSFLGICLYFLDFNFLAIFKYFVDRPMIENYYHDGGYSKYVYYILDKIYHYLSQEYSNVNLFNSLSIFVLFVLFFSYLFPKKEIVIFFKVISLGVFSYYLVYSMPVLQVRILTLVGVVSIIVYFQLARYFKPTVLFKTMVLFYSVLYFYRYVFIKGFFNFSAL